MNTQTAIFGNGCFWCLEAEMRRLRGVVSATSGYAGGHTQSPTYEEVATGATGHAEVVQVIFDPAVITYADLLRVFWTTHDPTTPNRSGNDIGPEYRSIILTTFDEQRRQAEASRARQQANWPSPIVTEILPLDRFWPAESNQEDYYRRHPDRAYCTLVINPKLQKLKSELRDLLKEEYQ